MFLNSKLLTTVTRVRISVNKFNAASLASLGFRVSKIDKSTDTVPLNSLRSYMIPLDESSGSEIKSMFTFPRSMCLTLFKLR